MPPRRANPNPNKNNVTPEMQQLMTAQAQLMQMMTTFMQNQNNNNNNNNQNNPPGFDMLTRFLRLRPTKFSETTDPMVANDWLCSVNKDLVTVAILMKRKLDLQHTCWKDQQPLGGITSRSPLPLRM